MNTVKRLTRLDEELGVWTIVTCYILNRNQSKGSRKRPFYVANYSQKQTKNLENSRTKYGVTFKGSTLQGIQRHTTCSDLFVNVRFSTATLTNLTNPEQMYGTGKVFCNIKLAQKRIWGVT